MVSTRRLTIQQREGVAQRGKAARGTCCGLQEKSRERCGTGSHWAGKSQELGKNRARSTFRLSNVQRACSWVLLRRKLEGGTKERAARRDATVMYFVSFFSVPVSVPVPVQNRDPLPFSSSHPLRVQLVLSRFLISIFWSLSLTVRFPYYHITIAAQTQFSCRRLISLSSAVRSLTAARLKPPPHHYTIFIVETLPVLPHTILNPVIPPSHPILPGQEHPSLPQPSTAPIQFP